MHLRHLLIVNFFDSGRHDIFTSFHFWECVFHSRIIEHRLLFTVFRVDAVAIKTKKSKNAMTSKMTSSIFNV